MFSNTEPSIDETLERLRNRSPLPVFAAIVLGTIIAAFAVNLLSGVAYNLLLYWFGLDNRYSAQQLNFDFSLLIISSLLTLLGVLYLWMLADQQSPHSKCFVQLVLPFVKKDGRVRLVEIKKMQALSGMDNILNQAVEHGNHENEHLKWDFYWRLEDSQGSSPIHEDAVVLLYDLVEWIVIREINAYGKLLYESIGFNKPGDDLRNTPLGVDQDLRSMLFENGIRSNYLWQHGNQSKVQKLKVPTRTTLTFKELSRKHGVEHYGDTNGTCARKLIVCNPGGTLIVTPSQIWREVNSKQIRRILEKDKSVPTNAYFLEMQLSLDVKLNQRRLLWPWRGDSYRAYQRWLLELQRQMVRHMDFKHYIAHDYPRMLVDIRDIVTSNNKENML